MMNEHICYDADADPEGGFPESVFDVRPEDAAEEWAEQHYAGNEYPEVQRVRVISPDGSARVFAVTAIPSTYFSAREEADGDDS